MMVELKVKLLIHQVKVFLSMVSSLKVQDGTDKINILKTQIQKNCTTNSQFFTCLLYQQLSQQVVLQVLVKLPDKSNSKLKNFYILAQFISIQEEMTNILFSDQESKLKIKVLHKDQTKE
jgi:hypothetical protein